MADNRRWQRRPVDVAFVDDGVDRVAMVDLLRPADPPIVLEGTSASIWRLLETPRTIAEMVDELTQVYDAPRDDIEVGVESFVADLAARGLAVHFSNVA